MGILDSIRGFFTNFDPTPVGPVERTAGQPPSANGASSFHLWWAIPSGKMTQVAATVEVRTPPGVDALHFFAVQASFEHDRQAAGGAHLGLQWNPRFPDSRAVNWGGYDSDGSILSGSDSPLPSTPNDPNTRDYPWQPEQRYRLVIGPAEPVDDGWEWPGTIVDLNGDYPVTVRRLRTRGDELTRPVMWSEVFAACDAPSIEVRWTDLVVTTEDGETEIASCTAAYQLYEMGGCTNTNSSVENGAFVQRTSTERTTAPGWTLDL